MYFWVHIAAAAMVLLFLLVVAVDAPKGRSIKSFRWHLKVCKRERKKRREWIMEPLRKLFINACRTSRAGLARIQVVVWRGRELAARGRWYLHDARNDIYTRTRVQLIYTQTNVSQVFRYWYNSETHKGVSFSVQCILSWMLHAWASNSPRLRPLQKIFFASHPFEHCLLIWLLVFIRFLEHHSPGHQSPWAWQSRASESPGIAVPPGLTETLRQFLPNSHCENWGKLGNTDKFGIYGMYWENYYKINKDGKNPPCQPCQASHAIWNITVSRLQLPLDFTFLPNPVHHSLRT